MTLYQTEGQALNLAKRCLFGDGDFFICVISN